MNKINDYSKIIKENFSNLQESELNKWLYHITLELYRYQDMTKELLDYMSMHYESKEVQDMNDIIKKWGC